MTVTVLSSAVRINNVLWQTVQYVDHGPSRINGIVTRAVCRVESCADGHRCGMLDLGVTGPACWCGELLVDRNATSGNPTCSVHCSKCGHDRRYEDYLDFCSECRSNGPCAPNH